LVCDPSAQQWDCDYFTPDIEQFLSVAKDNERCLLVIDEAGRAVGRAQSESTSHRLWLATESRHKGHSAVFLAQRAPMLSPTVVAQCQKAWIFRQHYKDLQTLAQVFCNDQVLEAAKLGRGQCIYVDNFGAAEFIDVFSLDSGPRLVSNG